MQINTQVVTQRLAFFFGIGFRVLCHSKACLTLRPVNPSRALPGALLLAGAARYVSLERPAGDLDSGGSWGNAGKTILNQGNSPDPSKCLEVDVEHP